MEVHYSFLTTLTTILFVIVIAFLVKILNKKMANEEKMKKPPQAEGAWPIIGHLHLLGGAEPPHKVLGDMAEKYGPIFTIKLGVHNGLVVTDKEIVKECFTINDKIFSGRPRAKAVELMGYNYAMFGLGPHGNFWRQMRKIVVEESLSRRRVEMVEHIRVSELEASIKAIYDAWVNNKESECSDMVKVEMKQWFEKLVLNVIVRIISGKRFPPDDKEGVRILNAVHKFFELAFTFVVSDFIPYTNGLDLGGCEKKMKIAGEEMDNILEGWLKERKSGTQQEGDKFFIDVLNSLLQGASEEDFPGLDHNTILKATFLTFLVGGMEAISVTLTRALSLLVNNPKALETAQREIDEHVGMERLVQESDMKNLIYLDAIIKETLRLYSGGPLTNPRESTEDCVVSGYNIPKGTRLLVNFWKIHHDPNIWSDPHEFKPERFLTSQKDLDVKGNHFEYLPFGSGRRICPGVYFSLQVLSLILASLIQQFVLKRPLNEPVDMIEIVGVNNSKTKPLEVLLAPRLSLGMYPVCA